MSEWVETRLGIIAPFKYGKALREESRRNGEYNVYSSAGICGFSDKTLALKGIVVGRKGTVGSVFYTDLPFFCIDTAFYIDEVSDDCNMKFIYYYMQLMNLGSFNNDAAVPGLNRNLAHKLKITIPDLPTQTRIADILSAYDDAIENNNRRIALLEQAARELYREWFVRFRFPGHESAKFLNGLPEGWEVKRLGELSDFRYGTMPVANRVSESGYPIFSGYRITGYYDEYMFSDEQLILIARGVGGTGEVRISPKFCYLTNLSIAFLLKNELLKFYLYERFQQCNLRELDTGAAQSQITIGVLEGYKVILPTESLLIRFDELAKTMCEEKSILQQQSQNLARQRDLLLPRLMNRKLEV